MFLPFVILINIILITPSWCIMSSRDFETFILPKCFRLNSKNLPYINGQENPLASTLENFISLAEKFEALNPDKDLKYELYYFIRNFTYTNIEYNMIGDVVRWTPKESNYAVIDTLWELDEELRTKYPDVKDPFTDAELCSLYFMLSHSIIRKSRKIEEWRSIGKDENSTTKSHSEYLVKDDFNYKDEDLYPMEQGVVAIQGSREAVDLGRVLTGIYVGLNDGRKKEITEFTKSIPQDKIPTDSILDPLYTLTIAEVIAMAGWRPEAGQRQYIAKDGYWRSVAIGTEIETSTICPMIYRLNDGIESAFSFNSLRGAADGLILGKVISDVVSRNRDIKLSEVLRQFYSRGGFAGKTPDLGYIHASFCNRDFLLSNWEEEITKQVRLFILLASTSFGKTEDSLTFSMDKYSSAKRDGALKNMNQETKDYCGRSFSETKFDDYPFETPLDVIVVLDTSVGEADEKKQQLIIGHLAKRLQLMYQGSRMTIFTDQPGSAPSVSTPNTIYLKTIVDQTYSSACAACAVTQLERDNTASIDKYQVIIALNQYLTEKRENETQYSGVNGKVIVLFDFEENLPPPGRRTAEFVRLEKALTDLHLSHRDVSIYPLGKNFDVLKKYSRGDTNFPMSAVDIGEDQIGKNLYSKIIAAPGKLQYANCENGKDESRAIYENYISPNSVQHWAMPAKYFHKSFNLKFVIESFYGPAKVCWSRDTKFPEREVNTCQDLANGSPVQFPYKDPCKGFTENSCSLFYFSIIGVNDTVTRTTRQPCEDKTTENKCKTMDQVKFSIRHEGIRCSGSMGLIATPIFLLLTMIISHLLSINV